MSELHNKIMVRQYNHLRLGLQRMEKQDRRRVAGYEVDKLDAIGSREAVLPMVSLWQRGFLR